MSWELWIAFAAASSVLLAIPGPTIILVISYALGHGRSSVPAVVSGVTLGDFVAMTASLVGAGAVLAASANLFTVMKLVGAGYLIWLGIQLWRTKPDPEALNRRANGANNRRMFVNAFVVTALNPKGIVFFVAFVPQFLDASRPMLAQFVILEATFLVLAAVNAAFWGLLAGHMRDRMRRPQVLRTINRIGGSFLIGAGLLTALTRRVT